MTDQIKEALKNRPSRVKAIIDIFLGGYHCSPGKMLAIISPEYYKNGNIKRSKFTIIQELETLKGYGYGFRHLTKRINDIIEIIE